MPIQEPDPEDHVFARKTADSYSKKFEGKFVTKNLIGPELIARFMVMFFSIINDMSPEWCGCKTHKLAKDFLLRRSLGSFNTYAGCSEPLASCNDPLLYNVKRLQIPVFSGRAPRGAPRALCASSAFCCLSSGGLAPFWHGDWVCPLCPWPNNIPTPSHP